MFCESSPGPTRQEIEAPSLLALKDMAGSGGFRAKRVEGVCYINVYHPIAWEYARISFHKNGKSLNMRIGWKYTFNPKILVLPYGVKCSWNHSCLKLPQIVNMEGKFFWEPVCGEYSMSKFSDRVKQAEAEVKDVLRQHQCPEGKIREALAALRSNRHFTEGERAFLAKAKIL